MVTWLRSRSLVGSIFIGQPVNLCYSSTDGPWWPAGAGSTPVIQHHEFTETTRVDTRDTRPRFEHFEKHSQHKHISRSILFLNPDSYVGTRSLILDWIVGYQPYSRRWKAPDRCEALQTTLSANRPSIDVNASHHGHVDQQRQWQQSDVSSEVSRGVARWTQELLLQGDSASRVCPLVMQATYGCCYIVLLST